MKPSSATQYSSRMIDRGKKKKEPEKETRITQCHLFYIPSRRIFSLKKQKQDMGSSKKPVQ